MPASERPASPTVAVDGTILNPVMRGAVADYKATAAALAETILAQRRALSALENEYTQMREWNYAHWAALQRLRTHWLAPFIPLTIRFPLGPIEHTEDLA